MEDHDPSGDGIPASSSPARSAQGISQGAILRLFASDQQENFEAVADVVVGEGPQPGDSAGT